MQKRKLGVGDTYVKFAYEHANGTTGVSAIVRISGPVTAELIRQSLKYMQVRHPHLRAVFSESGDSLVFEELGRDWQRLERQVERLGFANEYFVSLTKGPRGELTKVTPARKS